VRKIPTLFLRDPDNLALVTPEYHPACDWVRAGEGVATRKYDGTCVRLTSDGLWWARREVKPGKAAPTGYVPVELDEVTGKTVGWAPIEQSAFAKFHAEALVNCPDDAVAPLTPGTYELIGPKINGNPERVQDHLLISHDRAEMLNYAPRNFEGLRTYLTGENFSYEGIVWHHLDGRMAKLKRRDFGGAR
jgi:hypothetical protein